MRRNKEGRLIQSEIGRDASKVYKWRFGLPDSVLGWYPCHGLHIKGHE